MRAIWTGALTFGLINIPISLYPASHREELSFRLLREGDMSPISHKRVAEADGKEVPWEEIVRGYEYAEGKFVVLREEDFARVDVAATQSIDLLEFVPLEDINLVFFDRPYYVEPRANGERGYALLREALRRTGRVGIAKVVFKTRQHLAALKPERKALLLELMHFAEELLDPDSLALPDGLDLGDRELAMATELVERRSGRWHPEKYQDDYRHALQDLIQQKIDFGDRPPPEGPPPAKRPPTKVIDLESVLEESLAQSAKGFAAEAGEKSRKEAA